MSPQATPGDAVEAVARRHYGRLVAYLAAGFRDLALAEDALQDALLAAVSTWPVQGVPRNPEGWLMAAARRKIMDRLRHHKVSQAFAQEVRNLMSDAAPTLEDSGFPDDRLKLMFVCAHPAIDPAAHTPLMLQTVLGLDARRIAEAFIVSAAAMGRRLTRTKAKIAATRIAFEIPDVDALPQRLGAVLDAIYAAYASDWGQFDGMARQGLTQEALYLGQLCVDLSGRQPEALGLQALMLFCEARALSRYGEDGGYVPLDQQDTARWDAARLADAERLLAEAALMGQIGRHQLEAAIQSATVNGRLRGIDTRPAVVHLYRGLLQQAPGIGAGVGYAAALVRNDDAAGAWVVMESLPGDRVKLYQPYWAVAAEILARLGRIAEASAAYDMAEGLSDIAAVKAYLRGRRQGLVAQI